MKTKVLVWRARDAQKTAEQILNEWLEENKGITIKHITQSESGSVIANLRITYTIFYE